MYILRVFVEEQALKSILRTWKYFLLSHPPQNTLWLQQIIVNIFTININRALYQFLK